MSLPNQVPAPATPTSRWTGAPFCLLLALCAAGLAITGRSLWIDEANSAAKAMCSTPGGWWDAMFEQKGSDLQMPLYMFALWGWEKLAGHSEWALRALNLPFFVLAVMTVVVRLPRPGSWRFFYCAFACASAFQWFYLDEARPYTMQFLAASMIHVALLNLLERDGPPPTGDAVLFFSGLFILCASSLLGVIFALCHAPAFLYLWMRRQRLGEALRRPGVRLLTLVAILLLGGLAWYYLKTLAVGARASAQNRTDLMTLAFCGYEMLGFSGTGPGRLELRAAPMEAVRSHLPALLVHMGCLLYFLAEVWRSFRPLRAGRTFMNAKAHLIPPLAVLAGVGVVGLLGVATHFRVLGRHWMPAQPLLLMLAAVIADRLWASRRRSARWSVCLLLAASLYSCLALRFAPRHFKDDYRLAAAEARTALEQGRRVWWSADIMGAAYYGLSLAPGAPEPAPGAQALEVRGLSRDELSRLLVPDIILLSKPDVYDPEGSIRSWAEGNGWTVKKRFPAFSVWLPAADTYPR